MLTRSLRRVRQPDKSASPPEDGSRKGAIVILSAFLLVFLFGLVAFSVDLGYISIVRSELQSAADGAALAGVNELGEPMSQIRGAAEDVALANTAADEPVEISADGGRVQQGWFDPASKNFTARNRDVNAVRVQLRKKDMPLFFAPVIGTNDFDAEAEAIAMVNPRDIVFVVDLSGSMNNDTEVSWSQELLDARFPGNVGTAFGQDLYDDLGFGTYPGRNEHIGANAYEWVRDRISDPGDRATFEANYRDIPDYYFEIGELTGNDSPLTHSDVPNGYRIRWNDNESRRRTKAYNWIMDHQIASLMPRARPVANSRNGTSRRYWHAYLDYVTYRATYSRTGSSTQHAFSRQNGSTRNFTFPSENSYRKLYYLGNPGYPNSNWNVLWKDLGEVGYRSYVTFMNDYGWNGTPYNQDHNLENPAAPHKPQISRLSPHCRWHDEDVNGQTFSFPPRTQPMHACRRSIIAAMQMIRDSNDRIADIAADHVAVITYDAVHTWSRPTIVHPLDADYDDAMEVCTEMQACYDGRASTATENALLLARNHLKTRREHRDGAGREHAAKAIILLTDGMPNLYESDESDIDSHILNNPSGDYYTGSGQYARNAPLVQADQIAGDDIQLFGLSMGMGANADFMGRLARLARTDQDGQPLSTAGDPYRYEEILTDQLRDIINNGGIRLVK